MVWVMGDVVTMPIQLTQVDTIHNGGRWYVRYFTKLEWGTLVLLLLYFLGTDFTDATDFVSLVWPWRITMEWGTLVLLLLYNIFQIFIVVKDFFSALRTTPSIYPTDR